MSFRTLILPSRTALVGCTAPAMIDLRDACSHVISHSVAFSLALTFSYRHQRTNDEQVAAASAKIGLERSKWTP